MPFTFSHEPQTDSLIVVEGARQHWQSRPVSVEIRRCAFFERPPFSQAGLPALANAFYVENVEYPMETRPPAACARSLVTARAGAFAGMWQIVRFNPWFYIAALVGLSLGVVLLGVWPPPVPRPAVNPRPLAGSVVGAGLPARLTLDLRPL